MLQARGGLNACLSTELANLATEGVRGYNFALTGIDFALGRVIRHVGSGSFLPARLLDFFAPNLFRGHRIGTEFASVAGERRRRYFSAS